MRLDESPLEIWKRPFQERLFVSGLKYCWSRQLFSDSFPSFYPMTNVSQEQKWPSVSHQQYFIQLLPNYVLKFPLSSPGLLDTTQFNSLIHQNKWEENRLEWNITEASEHIFSKLSKEWAPVFHFRLIYGMVEKIDRDFLQPVPLFHWFGFFLCLCLPLL